MGFARYNFDIQQYLHALQTTTLSSFSSSVSSLSPEERTELSWAVQERTGDSIADGLDVYDPNFSDDFSDVTSGVLTSGSSATSLTTGWFGFIANTGVVSVSSWWNPKTQLLELIKARELKK